MKVLDEGYVDLVEAWGSDEGIIEAARMSTGKGFNGWGTKEKPGDEKLLRYLYENKHSTPFEMAGMTIEVKAPIFVFREWHRHRTQCLAGDTMICCVSPAGATYQRTIKNIFELKYGGVIDQSPLRHKNGYSKSGGAVTREARRVDPWRTRILPNCQNRILRVLNEETGDFLTANMADVWESGVKPIYMLETVGGHAVRASENHPFWTRDGWVKMKDMQAGVEVARMGKVASNDRPIPPALRSGIGVWTSMMRSRLIRDQDDCYICGLEFARDDLILDHVIPVSKSLLTALDERNLKPACYGCSRQKTNTEQPSRVGMSKRGIRWERLLSKPRLVGEEMTYDIEVAGEHSNYVANGLVVHNSYNEMSARYIPLPDENYLPSVERVMAGANTATTNKQAQGNGKTLSEADAKLWIDELRDFYEGAESLYQWGLRLGVPKELARVCIPVGRYSRMRASANLRNWLGFLTLRMAPEAQWEIRRYANVVGTIIADRFPRTWELFHETS